MKTILLTAWTYLDYPWRFNFAIAGMHQRDDFIAFLTVLRSEAAPFGERCAQMAAQAHDKQAGRGLNGDDFAGVKVKRPQQPGINCFKQALFGRKSQRHAPLQRQAGQHCCFLARQDGVLHRGCAAGRHQIFDINTHAVR